MAQVASYAITPAKVSWSKLNKDFQNLTLYSKGPAETGSIPFFLYPFGWTNQNKETSGGAVPTCISDCEHISKRWPINLPRCCVGSQQDLPSTRASWHQSSSPDLLLAGFHMFPLSGWWWCNNHLERWWSSSMARMIPFMKSRIKHVPKHQPVMIYHV